MIVRLGRWIAPLVVLLVIMAGCGEGNGPGDDASGAATGASQSSDTLRVVVSIPLFVSMVEAVGGDHVDVQSIVPSGVDPHTYQPSPSNAQAIADADVIFVNGRGLEEWLSGLIESTGGADAAVSELTAGLEAKSGEDGHGQEHAGSATTGTETDHEHPEGDPHLWLDPIYARHYVEVIADGLSERDPSRAAEYQENAERYNSEIQEFNSWAETEIEKIPLERRKLVTFHDAYGYFAEHFGLDQVGSIVISPGREPSPQELARLVDEIRAQHVPAIFTEPQFNPRLAETIAREADVEIVTLYSDTPPEGGGYLEMMRQNIENVVEGLS